MYRLEELEAKEVVKIIIIREGKEMVLSINL
jgi:hypothetical protein